MQHADRPGVEIRPALERIDEPAGALAAAPTAIALTVNSRRKRSSSIVDGSTVGSTAGARSARARRDHIDVLVVSVLDDCRPTRPRLDAATELSRERLGERLPVALDRKVDVEARLASRMSRTVPPTR